MMSVTDVGRDLRVDRKSNQEVAYFVRDLVRFHLIYAYDLISTVDCRSTVRD